MRNLLLFGVLALLSGLAAGVGISVRRWTLAKVQPPRQSLAQIAAPAAAGVPYEDITLISADGIRLSGWYTPPRNGVVILAAHGHGDLRSPDMHVMFARQGYGVLSWDFRAHGASGGEACTLGYNEALDVEAALDFARQQAGVRRVGAWGGSMGGAAVLRAAARRPEIAAVAVDSVFSTLEEELAVQMGIPLLRPLVRGLGEWETGIRVEDVRPVDWVKALSPRPVMIISGEADSTIPPGSGERLYQAAGDPRRLWSEPGIGHLGLRAAQPVEYERRVVGFFDDATR